MKVIGQEFLTSVAMTSIMATGAQQSVSDVHAVTSSEECVDVEQRSEDQSVRFDFELAGIYHDNQDIPVPGVGASLRLRRTPRVVVRDFKNCCIDEWGISVSCAEATPTRMANEVVYAFLDCFRKAQQRLLTLSDRKVWRSLLSDLDSSMYVEHSAPPVQDTGVLKTLRPGYAVIQWSDDPADDERVDGVFRQRLSFLHEGDTFTATVKFVAGKLVYIDNVMPCNG